MDDINTEYDSDFGASPEGYDRVMVALTRGTTPWQPGLFAHAVALQTAAIAEDPNRLASYSDALRLIAGDLLAAAGRLPEKI